MKDQVGCADSLDLPVTTPTVLLVGATPDAEICNGASAQLSATATGGEEVKNLGDGLMIVYRGASDAIDGAVAMQRAVARGNLGGGVPLAMKVGISVGDISEEDGDWFGTPVNEAARLCAAAVGGQVLIADIVRVLAGSRTRHAIDCF